MLTTELEYGPLVELGHDFTLFGEGAGFRNWWGRWSDECTRRACRRSR